MKKKFVFRHIEGGFLAKTIGFKEARLVFADDKEEADFILGKLHPGQESQYTPIKVSDHALELMSYMSDLVYPDHSEELDNG